MQRPKPKNHHPLPEHAEKVFHGVRWQVHQWEQEQFDGTIKIFESVKRPDTVTIFPIIDDKVVVLEEEQPHWGRKSDSIIAGGIEDGEDIFVAAQRELKEETGMIFKDFFLVQVDQSSSDIHWYNFVFVAQGLIETKEKKLDSGEKTEPKQITFTELIDFAKQKKFFHRPYFIEDHIIQDKIDTLFDIFKNPSKYSI